MIRGRAPIPAFFLAIAVVAFVSGCASDPMKKGLSYYQRGYCSVSVPQWLSEARKGNAAAKNDMGLIWLQGCPDVGIPMNNTEAYNWFVLAAQNGEPVAMLNLGDMHRDGLGTQKDSEKAKVWYTLAARRGNPSAQARLVALGATVPTVDFPVARLTSSTPNSPPHRGSSVGDWLQVFAAALIMGSSNEYRNRSNSQPAMTNAQYGTNCYSTVSSYSEGNATVKTTCR